MWVFPDKDGGRSQKKRADGGLNRWRKGSEIQTMRASCKHDSTFMTPT